MIYQIILWWASVFLRLYFRRILVYGQELIPEKGPLIVASNHPSAFLEASILATVIGRQGRHIHFLVRGDMFHPRFRWLFKWTKQIPIYRQKDGIQNLRKNASTFDLTYRKLAEGEAVLIFPEAKTILEKKMRPIQRGTAHLAFGTLPFMQADQGLAILPVAVNFTEPRLPGTDVVVRFDKPFLTENGTREDRDAIEVFTEGLSQVMSPLIIQVENSEREADYDVLASVYFRFVYNHHRKSKVHQDLVKLANYINQQSEQEGLLNRTRDFRKRLKLRRATDLIYFPNLLVANRLVLLIMILLKVIWLITGGWIWRLARNLIFKKIKSITFQSPVTLGAAMVLYPLAALLLLVVCLIAGAPWWVVPGWIFWMGLGALFRPSLPMIATSLMMSSKERKVNRGDIHFFKKEVLRIIDHQV